MAKKRRKSGKRRPPPGGWKKYMASIRGAKKNPGKRRRVAKTHHTKRRKPLSVVHYAANRGKKRRRFRRNPFNLRLPKMGGMFGQVKDAAVDGLGVVAGQGGTSKLRDIMTGDSSFSPGIPGLNTAGSTTGYLVSSGLSAVVMVVLANLIPGVKKFAPAIGGGAFAQFYTDGLAQTPAVSWLSGPPRANIVHRGGKRRLNGYGGSSKRLNGYGGASRLNGYGAGGARPDGLRGVAAASDTPFNTMGGRSTVRVGM